MHAGKIQPPLPATVIQHLRDSKVALNAGDGIKVALKDPRMLKCISCMDASHKRAYFQQAMANHVTADDFVVEVKRGFFTSLLLFLASFSRST